MALGFSLGGLKHPPFGPLESEPCGSWCSKGTHFGSPGFCPPESLLSSQTAIVGHFVIVAIVAMLCWFTSAKPHGSCRRGVAERRSLLSSCSPTEPRERREHGRAWRSDMAVGQRGLSGIATGRFELMRPARVGHSSLCCVIPGSTLGRGHFVKGCLLKRPIWVPAWST